MDKRVRITRNDKHEYYCLYSSGLLTRADDPAHKQPGNLMRNTNVPLVAPSKNDWNDLVVINNDVREMLGRSTTAIKPL